MHRVIFLDCDISIQDMKMCVVIHGKRNGPHEPDEVRRLFRSGELGKENLAWKTGMQDWQPLHEVWPELFEANGGTSIESLLTTETNGSSSPPLL